MEEYAGAAGAGKFWCPVEKGLENRSPMCSYSGFFFFKMLRFFSAFSLGPKEGRICAATSDFVATLIFHCHGDKWGQMSFVAH